jgi:small subunit ribosomal protein S1
VDPDERKIGLSRKRVEWAEEASHEPARAAGSGSTTPSIPAIELKGGVGKSTGPLIQPLRPASEETPPEPPK